MATHFAARLAMIAFAAVTVQGAIEFADFQVTVAEAMKTVAMFFGMGLVIGELARRTVEEIAHTEFQQITASEASHSLRVATDAAPNTQH